MPLFFFHLRTPRGVEADDIGTPFPDVESAYLDVCRAIPEMLNRLLSDGQDPLRCAFEITDDGGRALMDVPFSERLTRAGPGPLRPASPGATAPPPTCDDALRRLFASCAAIRAESETLRDSVAATARRVARTAAHGGLPFLEQIALTYGVSDAAPAERG